VDFQTGQITVRRSEWHGQVTSTKGNRMRFVPMTARLTEALRQHRHLHGPLVLYREIGEPMAEHHLEEVLRGALRDAGLSGGPHVLRHTFCSHAIVNGLTVKEVQQLAGHQDLKTLERYVHLRPGALHAAMEKLDRGRHERLGEIRATRNRVAVS
jgi:site-specific recombinase XerD